VVGENHRALRLGRSLLDPGDEARELSGSVEIPVTLDRRNPGRFPRCCSAPVQSHDGERGRGDRRYCRNAALHPLRPVDNDVRQREIAKHVERPLGCRVARIPEFIPELYGSRYPTEALRCLLDLMLVLGRWKEPARILEQDAAHLASQRQRTECIKEVIPYRCLHVEREILSVYPGFRGE